MKSSKSSHIEGTTNRGRLVPFYNWFNERDFTQSKIAFSSAWWTIVR